MASTKRLCTPLRSYASNNLPPCKQCSWSPDPPLPLARAAGRWALRCPSPIGRLCVQPVGSQHPLPCPSTSSHRCTTQGTTAWLESPAGQQKHMPCVVLQEVWKRTEILFLGLFLSEKFRSGRFTFPWNVLWVSRELILRKLWQLGRVFLIHNVLLSLFTSSALYSHGRSIHLVRCPILPEPQEIIKDVPSS